MKILILSQYFPPEIGAPQNRLYELAQRLKNHGIEVEVLTAMPNYPEMKIHNEYIGKWYASENREGIKIHRCWIFVSKSKSIALRLLNYFSFVFSSLIIGWKKIKRSDFILCESPPLFLGISAWALCKIKRAGLIFNVSDLWPESAEKLGLVKNKFFLRSATKLEEFLYKRSKLITGQTQGIVKNISSRFPNKNVYWLPNGVDLKYYYPIEPNRDWRLSNGFQEDDFILLYAGILGHAQGLEVILKAADHLRDHVRIRFVILGAGPERDHLIDLANKMKLNSVRFLSPVKKEKMPEIISNIDAAIIPLRKIDLFKGAIPSKIFESLAMEKPILLGVEGEAKELFIEEGKCGLSFLPENEISLKEEILKMIVNPIHLAELGKNGRKYVENKFNRDTIAYQFGNTLKELENDDSNSNTLQLPSA